MAMKQVRRVCVAMSGGVDSSVAALLMKRQGIAVHGVHMHNWDAADEHGADSGNCTALTDWQDVQRVCRQLDVPASQERFIETYWMRVFQPSLDEFRAGLTPNPDLLCNREVKFQQLLTADSVTKADALATGHYARLVYDDTGGPARLFAAADQDKDQTYFLAAVPGTALARVLFPLGERSKPEVRRIARQAGLATAHKKNSVGICMVGPRQFDSFLAGYLPPQPGPLLLVDDPTCWLGQHHGLWTFTIGQRARISGQPHPLYVVGKDQQRNAILLGETARHPALFVDVVYADRIFWVAGHPPAALARGETVEMLQRCRYRQTLAACRVRLQLDQDRVIVSMSVPQRAATPGQALVLYLRDPDHGIECLGGGIIAGTGPSYMQMQKDVPAQVTW